MAVLLVVVYFLVKDYLAGSNIATDKASAGNILVAASIIAVTACFGNFAFTYEKIDSESAYQRILAHFTTGLLMLVIGTSLIFTSILISSIMGHFILVDIILLALYTACVAYDFWDILRLTNNKVS
ncbi:MAG: hypothetical protein JW778_02425 [Candidatus Altiarchaeota archaeon]|nr:hypothetical protein [Candidatus Altiarchaeota archaeon]